MRCLVSAGSVGQALAIAAAGTGHALIRHFGRWANKLMPFQNGAVRTTTLPGLDEFEDATEMAMLTIRNSGNRRRTSKLGFGEMFKRADGKSRAQCFSVVCTSTASYRRPLA